MIAPPSIERFLSELDAEEAALNIEVANVAVAGRELQHRVEKAAHLRRAIEELRAYQACGIFEAEE